MFHPTSENQYDPIIIHKPQALPKETIKKPPPPSKPGRSLEKDLHTDPTQEAPEQKPLPRLSHEEKLKMIKARTDKQLTQAQLAQRINEPAALIKDIEAGKVIERKEVLTRIGRVLGVQLKC